VTAGLVLGVQVSTPPLYKQNTQASAAHTAAPVVSKARPKNEEAPGP